MLTILIYSFEFHPGTHLKGAAPPVGGRVATGRQFGHWDGKLWILQKMGDLAGKRKIIINMHKAREKRNSNCFGLKSSEEFSRADGLHKSGKNEGRRDLCVECSRGSEQGWSDKEFAGAWNLSIFLRFWRKSSAWDPGTRLLSSAWDSLQVPIRKQLIPSSWNVSSLGCFLLFAASSLSQSWRIPDCFEL